MDVMLDPCAFARPPPPGFVFPPRAPLRRLQRPPGFPTPPGRVVQPAIGMPVRRPRVPPGFPARPARCAAVNACVVQPAVDDVPVPPKLPTKRTAPARHIDADACESKRPRLCSDYDEELDNNFKEMDKDAEQQPSPDYLEMVQGGHISPERRAGLVAWMEKLARSYDLTPETLHRAVALVDRFLSATPLPIDKLRLVGAAAVYSAAKYEDQSNWLRKLSAGEIARYGGFASGLEVSYMELRMTMAPGFQLHRPTAYTFVEYFTRYFNVKEELDLEVRSMAYRLADQSLLNYECLRFLPSMVAASAIFMARLELSPPDVMPWSMELRELTEYSPSDLFDCVLAMQRVQQLDEMV